MLGERPCVELRTRQVEALGDGGGGQQQQQRRGQLVEQPHGGRRLYLVVGAMPRSGLLDGGGEVWSNKSMGCSFDADDPPSFGDGCAVVVSLARASRDYVALCPWPAALNAIDRR